MTSLSIEAPAGLPFIDMTREFAAPRDLVRRAHLDPDLVVRWLGPARYAMDVDHWDARDGGSYRYVHRSEDGQSFGFRGVFHSLTDDTLIQTFEFEGAPGHVSLDCMTLESIGPDRTRVRIHSVFQSVADRDAMVQAGMSDGVSEGYVRLDGVLADLASTPPAGLGAKGH